MSTPFQPLKNDAEGTVYYFATLSVCVVVKAKNRSAAGFDACARIAEIFAATGRTFQASMIRVEREATQEEIENYNFYEGVDG